jgi:16S rRNA (guanine527-N7)-methyltransferase
VTAPDPVFAALLERAGIAPLLRERLALYGTLVLEANRRFNLTGAKSADELTQHILDSLTVVPFAHEPYVDVGSGAGLPAIPVAIAASITPTMIEATAKKARFLQTALDALGLDGRVVSERAEIAAHRAGLREQFASGTARAVGTAPTVAELLLPFIELGGTAILQRGAIDAAELRAVEDAALMLGARVENEIIVGGDRRLLLVRKESSTPLRFPRRPGMPAKRPLCI